MKRSRWLRARRAVFLLAIACTFLCSHCIAQAPRELRVLAASDLQPVMQMSIKMNLKAADGSAVPDRITNTINVVPKE